MLTQELYLHITKPNFNENRPFISLSPRLNNAVFPQGVTGKCAQRQVHIIQHRGRREESFGAGRGIWCPSAGAGSNPNSCFSWPGKEVYGPPYF